MKPVPLNQNWINAIRNVLGCRFEILLSLTLYWVNNPGVIKDINLVKVVESFTGSSMIETWLHFIKGADIKVAERFSKAEQLEILRFNPSVVFISTEEEKQYLLKEGKKLVIQFMNNTIPSTNLAELVLDYKSESIKKTNNEKNLKFVLDSQTEFTDLQKHFVEESRKTILLQNEQVANLVRENDDLKNQMAAQEDIIVDLKAQKAELETVVEKKDSIIETLKARVDEFLFSKNWFNNNTPTQKQIAEDEGVSQSTISRRINNMYTQVGNLYKISS